MLLSIGEGLTGYSIAFLRCQSLTFQSAVYFGSRAVCLIWQIAFRDSLIVELKIIYVKKIVSSKWKDEQFSIQYIYC
jgi:hypothetical protein